jgi:hypothetical protein
MAPDGGVEEVHEKALVRRVRASTRRTKKARTKR